MNLSNFSTFSASAKVMVAAGAAWFVLSAVAQVNTRGDTGLDTSTNTAQERAWCLANTDGVARVDCLKEAGAAQGEKRRGTLSTDTGANTSNAVQRCEVFEGTERVACQARVLGYGNASGSVQGGGVIKQIETVELPNGPAAVVIEPGANGRLLVLPGARQ
jgi:hypothetical protein